ncbi:MAG: sugar ABC transporter ATP-binding protein [Oscillospiraceae bacterium]
MDYIVELKNITKTYPGVVALNDVSLGFKPGEVHAICGENGAGKSTLIKVMAGAATPEEGEIFVNGEKITAMDPGLSRQLGIEVIYQELILAPHVSVAENIYMGTRFGKSIVVDWNTMNEKAQSILNSMDITAFKATDIVENLKTANRQLVAIAKAISMNVKFLIMDEPTAPLGEHEVQVLLRIVKELKKKGVTIVYVSHRLDEVFEISDRVSVFRNGQWIKTMNTCDTDKNELIKLMVGRDIGSTYPERNSKIGDVVLKAKNIVAEGVKNVSFSVRAGEVLGIGGLVGSGRSELVNTIFGAQKMQSGEIFIKGKKVDINSPSKAIENGIGLIPEDRKLHGLMLEKDVGFNLSICILETISKYCVVDFKTEEQKQREIIERLRIKLPHAGVLAKTLSGGNQQKVVLAKWLLAEADVLIFDEPTRGVDVGAKQEIYQLINELTDKGMAVIMVSSDMEELMGVPDRIIVLHEGECTGGLDKKDFSQVEILKLASGIQEKTS